MPTHLSEKRGTGPLEWPTKLTQYVEEDGVLFSRVFLVQPHEIVRLFAKEQSRDCLNSKPNVFLSSTTRMPTIA